jgi:hypothetical protein
MHGRVSSCEEGESEDYNESSDGEVRGIDDLGWPPEMCHRPRHRSPKRRRQDFPSRPITDGIDQDFSVHVAATTSSLHTSPPRMQTFLQRIHTEARVRTPGSNIGEGSSGVHAPARTLRGLHASRGGLGATVFATATAGNPDVLYSGRGGPATAHRLFRSTALGASPTREAALEGGTGIGGGGFPPERQQASPERRPTPPAPEPSYSSTDEEIDD